VEGLAAAAAAAATGDESDRGFFGFGHGVLLLGLGEGFRSPGMNDKVRRTSSEAAKYWIYCS
jgi:hypothetical protein